MLLIKIGSVSKTRNEKNMLAREIDNIFELDYWLIINVKTATGITFLTVSEMEEAKLDISGLKVSILLKSSVE